MFIHEVKHVGIEHTVECLQEVTDKRMLCCNETRPFLSLIPRPLCPTGKKVVWPNAARFLGQIWVIFWNVRIPIRFCLCQFSAYVSRESHFK